MRGLWQRSGASNWSQYKLSARTSNFAHSWMDNRGKGGGQREVKNGRVEQKTTSVE